MSDSSVIAVIGILAALIGYWVQSSLARKSEQERFFRESKRELYGSFIDAFWQQADSRFNDGDSDSRNTKLKFVQLANKIALYGSPEVVICLSSILKAANFCTEDEKSRLTRLIGAMRRDLGEIATSQLDGPLHDILFTRADREGVQ